MAPACAAAVPQTATSHTDAKKFSDARLGMAELEDEDCRTPLGTAMIS